jgi:hypothetical protein
MEQKDPFRKLQEQMQLNDPFRRLQEQMQRDDPFRKLQEQMQQSDPFRKLQEHMQLNDPFRKLQEQMQQSDPFRKLQEQMQQSDPFRKLQEQMQLNDPFRRLQEQLQHDDPFRRLQEKISLQLATALTIVAEQDLAIEAAIAESNDPESIDAFQKFILFVDQLYYAIRNHIQVAQSASELFRIHNLITTLISAAALYYAMQSANTEDIDRLRSSVDQQTRVIQEEATISRLQMQETLSALAQSIHQMTATKAAELGYAIPYRVKRRVPIKAAKAMKAETVGAVFTGQVVFVLGYEKHWVRIEAIDLATGEKVSGWVVKKNLKRIK